MTLIKDSYLEFNQEDELTKKDLELIEAARKVCFTSHSPYSNFQVGAAIRLSSGQIVTGSNQENAAYPSGLCAERVALFYAAANFSHKQIEQIAVTAKRTGEETYLPVTPCGGCRQVMLEYENKQRSPIEVLMRSDENIWIKTRSSKVLLPFSFDKNSL